MQIRKILFFRHENRKCHNSECNAKNCELRHPKKCIFILQKKICKFGEFCSFEHDTEVVAEKDVTNELSKKLEILEQLVAKKNSEIDLLKKKISEMCAPIDNLSEFEDSDNETESVETLEDFDDNERSIEEILTDMDYFECKECCFKTEHEVGLKIHVSKAHKVKCEECGTIFKSVESLGRHNKSHEILRKIVDKENPSLKYELKLHDSSESCLGIFSSDAPREDNLPTLYLHSSECWMKSGHVCPDIPASFHDVPDDIDAEIRPNYDYYTPTLHALLDRFVYGDLTLDGCTVDWLNVEKSLAAW